MGTHNIKNVIEINGKRYDAISGAYLGEQKAVAGRPAARGMHVDGFRRVSRGQQVAAAKSQVQSIPTPAAHKAVAVTSTTPRPVHQPATHTKAHTPQPAKTLMRTAVKKPNIEAPSVIKSRTRTDILSKVPAHTIVPKQSHSKIDDKRLRRAERVIQSPAVSKYSMAPETPRISQPTQPAPATHQAVPVKAPVRSTLRTAQPHNNTAVAQHLAHTRARSHTAVPSSRSAAAQDNSHDIFQQALAEASTHKKSYRSIKRSSRIAATTSVIMTIFLVGFLGYQNMPYINLRVAANKAGIEAKMPGYSPEGFTFGSLSYSPGNVTVKYFSEANNNLSFNVSQRSSGWNSQALLDNFVAATSKSYQTVERAGRTIYLYGNNTATWVDNGIWYTIEGNESLTNTQIVDVALSI